MAGMSTDQTVMASIRYRKADAHATGLFRPKADIHKKYATNEVRANIGCPELVAFFSR